MQLVFDSVEEMLAFIKNHVRKPRKAGEKDDADDAPNPQPPAGNLAPAPAMPPAGAMAFAPQGGGFPGQTATPALPGVDPAILDLAKRIATRVDGALASGQSAETTLTWLRNNCGPQAANASLDQIKSIVLPQLPQATLENIAKAVGA